MTTETEWRDKQLNKHLEDDISELSNCCHEEIDERGLCSYCYEHCISVSEEYINAMEERADMEMEERKERRDD